MTTDMFHLSQPLPGPFHIHYLSPSPHRVLQRLVLVDLQFYAHVLQIVPYHQACNQINPTVPLVEQEQFTHDFRGFVLPIFSFMCMFCRSWFVLLYSFFWSLYCLFFFDSWILITSLWYLQTLLSIMLLNSLNKMTNKKYHTVGTFLKIPHYWNISKNTTLLEHF